MSLRSSTGGLRLFGGRTTPLSARAGGLAPPKFRPNRNADGFTLLEFIAVLALLGLICGLLIGGSSSFLRTMGKDEAETIALNAIASARHSAVLTGQRLELRYDDKARQFNWDGGSAALTGEGDARLLAPVKGNEMLLGGQAVETPLARVRFYPDGTCDPFRLQITRDKVSHIVLIDPWTCVALAPETAPGQH